MAKNASKCLPWLEKLLKNTALKWLKMHSKMPTMGGEHVEIYCSKSLKWLKMHSNCPPCLEKSLNTSLKGLKMHSNCQPWLEIILKFTAII